MIMTKDVMLSNEVMMMLIERVNYLRRRVDGAGFGALSADLVSISSELTAELSLPVLVEHDITLLLDEAALSE